MSQVWCICEWNWCHRSGAYVIVARRVNRWHAAPSWLPAKELVRVWKLQLWNMKLFRNLPKSYWKGFSDQNCGTVHFSKNDIEWNGDHIFTPTSKMVEKAFLLSVDNFWKGFNPILKIGSVWAVFPLTIVFNRYLDFDKFWKTTQYVIVACRLIPASL